MGIGAALAMVAGSLAVGALTAPEPAPETALEPTPISTTSTLEALETPLDLDDFSVDQIAVGTPLQWELAAGIDGVFGQHLVTHDDAIYVFGAFTDVWDDGPAATLAWRSVDGRNWESLGRVLETEHPVHLVASSPQGLIAVEMGEPDPVIWRSDDGTGWEPEVIPTDASSPYLSTFPTAVAANAGVTAVTANLQSDPTSLLQDRLETAGFEIDLSRFGWGQEYPDGELRLVVYGPLGIHLTELTQDDLALTDEELDAVNAGGGPVEATVWVRHEGRDWQRRTIEGASWVDSLVFEGRRLLAFGYGVTGSMSWASDDGGLTWEEIGTVAGYPDSFVRWRGGYVGMQQGGLFDVRLSEDGLAWEEAELDELFPYQLGWSPWALSAGEGGIAFVAEGWRSSGTEPHPMASRLTRDGATLNVNPQNGMLELVVGRDVYTWQTYGRPQDGLVVDMATEQVHFEDPESGERLATFTIDELSRAEQSFWPETMGGESFQAFVFSSDAVNWVIQDVEDDFGEGIRVFKTSISDDTVTAIVNSWSNVSGAEPGFEIWTAPIP
jgi:hypothetical protein